MSKIQTPHKDFHGKNLSPFSQYIEKLLNLIEKNFGNIIVLCLLIKPTWLSKSAALEDENQMVK